MYQIEVPLVFPSVLGEEEDLVEVNPYKNPQVVSKDIIHDAWERRWRVTEAKWHNSWFEGAKLCVKGGFPDMFVMDSNLMEHTDKTHHGKDGGTPQCTQHGLHRRQGVSTSNSSDIQGSVVGAHTPLGFAFLTSRQPPPYGLENGRIWPDLCNLSSCCRSSFNWLGSVL